MTAVLGWDVGGVNTKVARVVQGTVAAAHAQPYEIQRDPTALGSLLARLAAEEGAATGAAHAVTMTAELSQMFRTKREGVRFVLDAVTAAFPQRDVRAYAADGRFLSVAAARVKPLAVAAANWAATAHLVAQSFSEAILIDTGTTTTDIIPIAGGRVAARGRTDHERLREGELVYTGALRTPAEAIAHTVVLHGAPIGVSAEGFALAGDVHLWLGNLAPEDYTVPTPDGRPATRQFAGERLARVICADRELLDEAAIDAIARSLAHAQIGRVSAAPEPRAPPPPGAPGAALSGLGAFIAAAAARRAGLRVTDLAERLGPAARHAPAAAVALLLDAQLAPHPARS